MPNFVPIKHRVAFLVFADVLMLDIVGPLQVLREIGAWSGGRFQYDVTLISVDGGSVQTDLGQSLDTRSIMELGDDQVDTLLIAGGPGVTRACGDAKLLAGIKAISNRCLRIAAICTGTFLLAKTGLLSGKKAVTHWRFCDRLREAYPDVRVDPDAIYIRDGRIWTSGGVTSGIDMALAIAEEDFGAAVVLDAARELVVFPNRSGGQSQFVSPDDLDTLGRSEEFDELHHWMISNIGRGLSVSDLAKFVNMSQRTFARRYPQVTGQSPGRALEKARLAAAIRLLVDSNLPLKRVAVLSGHGDYERMRRTFVRSFGISPNHYRERFGRQG